MRTEESNWSAKRNLLAGLSLNVHMLSALKEPFIQPRPKRSGGLGSDHTMMSVLKGPFTRFDVERFVDTRQMNGHCRPVRS